MSKTLRLMALALVLALIAAACGGDGDAADEPADADSTATTAATAEPEEPDETEPTGLPDLGGVEVTVGVENAYLPFNYVLPGESEGQGWDYDAWDAICGLLNCVPVMTEAGWPAVIDEVAQGQLDTAADGISITDDRKEVVDFSDPYMVVEQKFVVQLGDDRFASAADIIDGDAIVGTQVGTTNYELASELLGGDARIQAFDQFAFAIQALIAGDVDAVIIDDAAGLGYIGENADQIETIDDSLQSDPLGFIFPLGSDLVDPVNQAIQVLKDDGTFDELGRKFFGESFTVTYDDIFPEEEEAALPDLGGVEVTVGVENAYLPFNYVLPGESEGQGWDYDAWDAICGLLNCVPVMTEAGWPAVIDEVAQGQLDTAADGISITDDRKEVVDFSDPYMVVEQKFVVQLGDDRFASAADIIDGDAIVGTQVGTTNYELASELLGGDARIQAFDQFAFAIQALIAGDVDAVIIDDAAGLGYIGENADQIETIDDSLQSDPLGFIFPLGSDLVDPVNQAIQVLKDDGTFDELGRKFFGESFTVTYDDLDG